MGRPIGLWQMPGSLAAALIVLAQAMGAHAQIPPVPTVSPTPVTALEYDARGNLTARIQAPGVPGLGLLTRFGHDAHGRLVSSSDARGGHTRLGYMGRDALSQVIDPRGLLTAYHRTGLGDLTGVLSPDTGSASHTFDVAGRLSTRTDSRGAVASYSYDALGRLRQLTHSRNGQTQQIVTWTYDQTGPGFSHGMGRLTSTAFPGGRATYAYDDAGRTVRVVQTVDLAGIARVLAVHYGYDDVGRLTSMRYPSGRVLSILHESGVPRALEMAADLSTSPSPLMTGLQFAHVPGAAADVIGWEWHLTRGTMRYSRDFDVHGRIVRYPLGGAVRELAYDAADRISAYRHLDGSTGTATAAARALDQAFGYDELGRITSVASSLGTWAYAYDANGNRTQMAVSSGSGSVVRAFQVDPISNRLSSLSQPDRVLAHDAAGNIVESTEHALQWTAVYGAAGRLDTIIVRSPATSPAWSTQYLYDASGLRVAKVSVSPAFEPGPPRCLDAAVGSDLTCLPPEQLLPATSAHRTALGTATAGAPVSPETGNSFLGKWRLVGTVFMYGVNGQLLGEYDAATGAVRREYVWLQDLPVAVIDGPPAAPTVYYLYNDHLGTPRVAIDSEGRQRWSWLAEPFGNSAPVTDPIGLGPWTLNLRMPGQYFDSESGLVYNGFRNYASELGRFVQSDPIGLAGGINTYAYVGGNPVKIGRAHV